MKKRICFLIMGILFLSCTKPSQCIESTGAIISKMYPVPNFDKIIVYSGVSLVVTQGTEYKVEVKTGENLIGDVEVKVTDGLLSIKDNTTCNWVRDYGQVTVYVTAPNLTDFISKTEKTISSNGILTYPIIRLQSIDLSDGAGTGDFNFQVNNNQLVIESNNVSNFYLRGKTNYMLSNFYEGNGRVEGAHFIADSIHVFHRGSNDMVLNPVFKIWGDMYSTGNIICKNHPSIVNVGQHYQGQLIFN